MVSAGAAVSASEPAPTKCTVSGEAPETGEAASAASGAVFGRQTWLLFTV